MVMVMIAWAHHVRRRPDTAAMPKRMGSAVAVSSGMVAKVVKPTMRARSQPVEIHGAALVAIRPSHRVAAAEIDSTAKPAIGM